MDPIGKGRPAAPEIRIRRRADGGRAVGVEPLICAYATSGAYEGEIGRLKASCDALGLSYVLDVIDPPAGGWIEAVRLKPWMLRMWREGLGRRDLLFVDADAVLHRDPWPLLSELTRGGVLDLGVHYLQGKQLLSGTLLLPISGKRTGELLEAWCEADLAEPDLRQPQRVLERVLSAAAAAAEFRILDLPAELCWIFDISRKIYGPRPAIIEHLQASRELRSSAGLGAPASAIARRRARIAEIEEIACGRAVG